MPVTKHRGQDQVDASRASKNDAKMPWVVHRALCGYDDEPWTGAGMSHLLWEHRRRGEPSAMSNAWMFDVMSKLAQRDLGRAINEDRKNDS